MSANGRCRAYCCRSTAAAVRRWTARSRTWRTSAVPPLVHADDSLGIPSVTPGVAGSSPVHSANNINGLASKELTRFFLFEMLRGKPRGKPCMAFSWPRQRRYLEMPMHFNAGCRWSPVELTSVSPRTLSSGAIERAPSQNQTTQRGERPCGLVAASRCWMTVNCLGAQS